MAVAQLIAQYGDPSAPIDVSTASTVRGVPCVASMPGTLGGLIPIELDGLGLYSIRFSTSTTLTEGDELVVELEAPGIVRQVWPCTVYGVETGVDGSNAVRARFRSRPAGGVPALMTIPA